MSLELFGRRLVSCRLQRTATALYLIFVPLLPIKMAPYVQDSLETPSSKLVNPIAPQHVNNMDPEFVAYYNRTIGLKKATHQVDIESVRSNPATFNSPWCEDTSKEQGVRDVRIASVDGFEFAARVYSPDASKFGAGPYPVHVNYHGEGV